MQLIRSIFTEIKAVYDLQSKYNPITENKQFSSPLNLEYVKSRFGKSAYQVKSGNLVVIMCPEERAVYKHPMNGRERDNLFARWKSGNKLTHSSLPIDTVEISDQMYFKFCALIRIRTKSEAKKAVIHL